MLKQLEKELKNFSDPAKAKIYARFFKTGRGDYGYGDVFLGVTVPQQRLLAKKYVGLLFADVKKLLHCKYHEHRLTGLFILVYKYEKSDANEREKIADFYIQHKNCSNNWDLIDCVADRILGKHLFGKDKSLLYKLAKSSNLWERRMAIISTFEFIKNNKFDDTLGISEILLNDKHDLIQKAVGWMLREIGKRNQTIEEKFLMKHYKKMPRTMLRYAIERFDEKKRKFYLRK